MHKRLRSEKAGASSAKKAKTMTRSSLGNFDWKTNFIFCGKTCTADKKHPERGKVVHGAEFKE